MKQKGDEISSLSSMSIYTVVSLTHIAGYGTVSFP